MSIVNNVHDFEHLVIMWHQTPMTISHVNFNITGGDGIAYFKRISFHVPVHISQNVITTS